VIKRRLREKRLMNRSFSTDDSHSQPGRFRKRSPFDCGNPRCGLCHGDKVYGIRSSKQVSSDEAASSQLDDLSNSGCDE